MHDVYVGIGSNVGDRVFFLTEAVRKLNAPPAIRVMKVSSLYETEPVGVKEQSSFLNAAVWVQTSAAVNVFHARIKSIEKEIGRKERFRWGPREIDIDILLFDDLIIHDTSVKIPHPEMTVRKFVLQPLAEIAPDIIHPAMKKSIKELFSACRDSHAVTLAAELTEKFLITMKES